MQSILVRALILWVPIAVAVTGLAGVTYGLVQQDLRQGANDPQIQMAEDAAASLNAGAAPPSVVPSEHVDMASTLQAYVLVFDASGNLVASSTTLNGQAPPFPSSVFNAAAQVKQDRITWQPQTGVRSASVVEAWRGGFVVAGRSLRLVEEREDQILHLTIFLWLATLGATAVATLLAATLLAGSRHRSPVAGQ